jgi:AcrR family transcriptional regulator
MARPRLIDDEQLLNAAREVFLERGGAATAGQVAKRAGISEAAIFKRFGTRQQLFLAAMTSTAERERFVALLKGHERDLRKGLIELGDRMLPFFRQVLPLLLMSWSSRGEFGIPLDLQRGEVGPARVARELIEFLKGEMRAKRIRKVKRPELIARTFVGSLIHYTMVDLIAGHSGARFLPPVSPKEYVRGVVDVIWEGIKP